MAYPSIAPPRERDLVLMEIFASLDLGRETVLRLNRCRVSLESIFLSDITTADGRYLEDFVFNPGDRGRSSSFKFPREVPTRDDWDHWFNFWHSYTATGNKLHVPLGNWINSTHRIWKWHYRAETDDLGAGLSEQKKALRSKKVLPGAKKRSREQKKVLPGAPEPSTFAERVIFSY